MSLSVLFSSWLGWRASTREGEKGHSWTNQRREVWTSARESARPVEESGPHVTLTASRERASLLKEEKKDKAAVFVHIFNHALFLSNVLSKGLKSILFIKEYR